MKATALLKRQHDEVTGLFDHYEQAEAEDEKQVLFEEIADSLAAHAKIEEQLFYPSAYSEQELMRQALEEHLAMKRILADLLEMSAEDEEFDAKMSVLREQVEHHVEEEEEKLFEQAEQRLGTRELERLGQEMESLFEQLMEEGPSDEIPAELGESAALER